MKKLCIALLGAALLLASLTACGKDEPDVVTSLPSLADVRDDAVGGETDGGTGGEGDVWVDDNELPEPDFVDEGEAAAAVTDEEVVSDLDFGMDYPSDWSYLSMEELGLDSYYIFAAGNRATGASIIVSQPLDAEGAELESFASAVYAGFDETIAHYEDMGITSQLGALESATLGGRDAKSITLNCSSTEADFVQTTYIVQAPNGQIISVVVSTYSDEDAAVAATALESIRWA